MQISKVTSYQAPDGTTFATADLAVMHAKKVAVTKALRDLVTGPNVVPHNDDFRADALTTDELPEWLYDNKDAILAAFKADAGVRQRKPRAKKAKVTPA